MPESVEDIEENAKAAPFLPQEEPAPRIAFHAGPCTRRDGDDCSRCMLICPEAAISFNDDGLPSIDANLCSTCGICIGVCDCFEYADVTTYDYAQRLARKAERRGRIVLCCKEDVFEGLEPAEDVVVTPCLSSISPEMLTYLLARKCDVSSAHDERYCDSCGRGGKFGPRLWKRSFDLASRWTQAAIPAMDAIPEKVDHLSSMANPDRRGLFTNAFAAVADVASGSYRERKSSTVDDFLARRDRMRAALKARSDAPLYLDEQSRKSSQEGDQTRRKLIDEALGYDPSIGLRMAQSGYPMPSASNRGDDA